MKQAIPSILLAPVRIVYWYFYHFSISLWAVFLHNFIYISYVTFPLKIQYEYACNNEIHDKNNENKQTEDNDEEIIG